MTFIVNPLHSGQKIGRRIIATSKNNPPPKGRLGRREGLVVGVAVFSATHKQSVRRCPLQEARLNTLRGFSGRVGRMRSPVAGCARAAKKGPLFSAAPRQPEGGPLQGARTSI